MQHRVFTWINTLLKAIYDWKESAIIEHVTVARQVLSVNCSLTKNKGLPLPILISFMHLYFNDFLLIASLIIYEKLLSIMTCALISVMLLVHILFIDTSLHKSVDWFTKLSFRLGTSEVSAWGGVNTSNLHHYFVL